MLWRVGDSFWFDSLLVKLFGLRHPLRAVTTSMDSLPISIRPDSPTGCLSNGGGQRYLLEAESTTGFVAWRLAAGTTLVSEAKQLSIRPSKSVAFWSCAGYTDTTPAGHITSFDCHGNGLTKLSVTALTGLQYLDCCYNKLTELDLSGLTDLQALDADHNRLTFLTVHHLRALRVLKCSHNRLQQLDVSGLAALQVLDCTHNPLTDIPHNRRARL